MTVKEVEHNVWKVSGENCSLAEITVKKNVNPNDDHVSWDIYFTSSEGKNFYAAQFISEDKARTFIEDFLKVIAKREWQGEEINCVAWAIGAWLLSCATRAR